MADLNVCYFFLASVASLILREGRAYSLYVMRQALASNTTNWTVYIIQCSDNSLYTGITNNLSRRFSQHGSAKGAKYFRGRQPVKVVYAEDGYSRSTASKREFAIKQLKHAEKMLLIQSVTNNIEGYF